MGRITYHPRPKNKSMHHVVGKEKARSIQDENKRTNEENVHEPENRWVLRPENIKAIGDVSCDYHIYLEDYVYTYLYQYACMDLKKEQSALLVGKISEETKEALIWGVIPVGEELLESGDEWISKEAIKYAEKESNEYFEGGTIIGWMHMQPGYGTMVTVKELKAHRQYFGQQMGIILLLDPINRIETFCVCEGEELREQTGYYMYYERNEQMQRYMLEHPLVKMEVKEAEDDVVAQFREIGKKRKMQYIQRKRTNAIILTASFIFIVLSIILSNPGINENGISPVINNQVFGQNEEDLTDNQASEEEDAVGVKVIINKETQSQEENNNQSMQELVSSNDNEKVQVLQTAAGQEGAEDALTNHASEVKDEDTSTANSEESVKVVSDEKPQEVIRTIHSEEEIIEEITEGQETVKYKEYVIQPGDTLRKISYKYYQTETKARDIAKFNNMTNTDYIQVGQKIKIPLE